jgi:superfamily II helicase
VFAQLNDADRPETVFALSAVLMHADAEVARSLRVAPDTRYSTDEREKVEALRMLMNSLRVTPETKVATMDFAVSTVAAGIEAAQTAQNRAMATQARLQAVEDEVFSQSVKT